MAGKDVEGANEPRSTASPLCDILTSERNLSWAEVQSKNIRNIAFCGHGSAGKTTLVDTLLTQDRDHRTAGQRGQRHQHLRFRRRGEGPQVHHRSQRSSTSTTPASIST